MRNIKITSFIITFFCIFSLLSGSIVDLKAQATGSFYPFDELYCKGIYMVDLDFGKVVAAKNEKERCFPASLTKLMTAVVAYENCSDISVPVTVTEYALSEFSEDDPNINGASVCGLCAGQTGLTMRDCLYGLLVKSGCEAGNVIADNIGKGEGKARIDDFIDMMNEKAKEIGCEDTHFSNTHGLWEEDNYSTPYDLYLIARYIYDGMPEIMDISDTYEYLMPANNDNPEPYKIYNVNGLVNLSENNEYRYAFARGMKTGSMGDYYTRDEYGNFTVKHEGFANVISTASKNGMNFMLVCCEAPYHSIEGKRLYGHYKDSLALYEWAFNNFSIMNVLNNDDIITSIDVDNGENADTVKLKPADDHSELLPVGVAPGDIKRNIKITAEKNEYGAVEAPVETGQVMGTLELVLDGETLFKTDLVAAQSIKRAQPVISDNNENEIIAENEDVPETRENSSGQNGGTVVIIVIMSIIAGLSVASVCFVIIKYKKKKDRMI